MSAKLAAVNQAIKILRDAGIQAGVTYTYGVAEDRAYSIHLTGYIYPANGENNADDRRRETSRVQNAQ